MENQKADNMLNLAWDATPSERERSLNLNTGYNQIERTWDVIIKYNGDISLLLRNFESKNIKIVPLLNRYAIVTASKSVLEQLLQIPQVEYMEMPKRIYFELNQGRRSSCINTVQRSINDTADNFSENPIQQFNLTGKGVLVGIIDSGVDIYHEDYRNADGSTRIVALWDQVQKNPNYPPPSGYVLGAYYSEDDLNYILMVNMIN